MDATLTIRLGQDLVEALEAEASKAGVSKGEIARQAIIARLGTRRKASSLARHFGVMKGPSDLSTNKEYRRTWNKGRA
ncbi:MAG: CopG family transcriptional regulator [Verrucomicrobiales bacterium]|nr:CopG family transcriptional regulator [Verrucomicrobiales bacterium]